MFSLRPVFKASLALLIFLAPSASVVVAQQDDKNVTLMTSDDNNTTDSSSRLMTNYNALREEGQGFFLVDYPLLLETPESVLIPGVLLAWWCDFEFSSEDANTTNYGYVGRGVGYYLGSTLDDTVAQDTQNPKKSVSAAFSVSAVLVPTLGIFEGQWHTTHDDLVWRYWDDGRSTLPILGWEGHDEKDIHPDADTSAWSGIGTLTKITPEAAANYLGMEVADLTPAMCSTEYAAAWNITHVPDPIDTSVTDLEETVAQLQADNKELLARIVAIEGSLPAN